MEALDLPAFDAVCPAALTVPLVCCVEPAISGLGIVPVMRPVDWPRAGVNVVGSLEDEMAPGFVPGASIVMFDAVIWCAPVIWN